MISCSATRIAPTPSGFLHIGNVLSFAITAWLAEQTGASVLLRVDDLDRERVREEYLEDIFDTLHFLDIPWQNGPRSSADMTLRYSQQHRMALYTRALDQLREGGWVYGCTCSRNRLLNNPCECAEKNISPDEVGVAWRMRTTEDVMTGFRDITGQYISMPLPDAMRHFVVRKRDGSPAYQLTSVCDDLHYGIDLVVRGKDLLASTLAQQFLAECLGATAFRQAYFYHHVLIEDDGMKLSKSEGAVSVQYMRKNGWKKEDVYQTVAARLHIKANSWHSLASAVLKQPL
ncbi:MAG TPA: glutamate--tRNA ligase family protein [Sediminibacterium sp.]